jgi:hypothetical protein
MRIEGIECEVAVALAAQTSYIEQMGLQGKVGTNSIDDNTGTRFLREKNWRGVDMYEVLRNLQISKNKILILKLLQRADLLRILLLLHKDQLINGLRFFSKEKLLRLLMMLPKQVLIKMLLHLFSMEFLISKMPTHEIFSVLRNQKITVRELVKGFEMMDPKFLHFILGKITGMNVQHLSMREMLDIFMKLRKRTILDGMQFLPFKALMPFILNFTKKDPTLFESLSLAFIFKLFEKMSKPSMLECFQLLPESMILKFLGQLPDKFLIQVAAQIDDGAFEKYLVSQQSNLLAMLGGGNLAA